MFGWRPAWLGDRRMAAFCRSGGISRIAFYKWRARFEAGGYWWDPKPGFLMTEDEVLDPLFEQERREARGGA